MSLRPARDPADVSFAIRGAWLAPRSFAPLDSDSARGVMAAMQADGVTHIAIGPDVDMPSMERPRLVWGRGDEALRRTLRDVRAAGMAAFLLPRIESPDFFEPPYPFRADIAFDSPDEWEAFHAAVERMLVHYAGLAQEERVAVFGIGLEMKQCVKQHPERWRAIIRAVREVYDGAVTYSANWYDEWAEVEFWDDLDFIGIGAYFELEPSGAATDDPVADIAARWTPIARRLARRSARVGKPILFTEIGYTGFADCVERPWEWTGKAARGAPVDHARQADAYAGLFRALGHEPWMAGTFVWTYYAGTRDIQDWEYALQGRPARDVVRRAYR